MIVKEEFRPIGDNQETFRRMRTAAWLVTPDNKTGEVECVDEKVANNRRCIIPGCGKFRVLGKYCTKHGKEAEAFALGCGVEPGMAGAVVGTIENVRTDADRESEETLLTSPLSRLLDPAPPAMVMALDFSADPGVYHDLQDRGIDAAQVVELLSLLVDGRLRKVAA